MNGLEQNGHANGTTATLPHLDLFYDHNRSEETARKLVYCVQPKWREHEEEIRFEKFTDGITNTLFKISRDAPGATQAEMDRDAVLMRAYGNNTDIIIDRDREARSHALLAQRSMAPPLLARFNNGLLYRFIPGKPSTPEDLTKENVWRGVARKLGEWHARVPIQALVGQPQPSSCHAHGHTNGYTNGHASGHVNGQSNAHANGTNTTDHGNPRARPLDMITPRPNLWSVLQGWVDALQTNTEKERAKKDLIQMEIERCFHELDNEDGIGERGLIFGHCDLLSANVIMLPSPDATTSSTAVMPVTFIDYEYATPTPAAFDIANHFSEWAGFDLDYNKLPTRSTRRAFLCEYLASYNKHARVKINEKDTLESLYEEIDRYRGIPGLYWGTWALIQTKISQIDFDYAQYAEDRLNEYWAWRANTEGSKPPEGRATQMRERRWNQEA